MFRKIYLLSWKNLLYFKRHYIVTAVQIILPCLFAIVLAYNNSQIEPREFSDGDGVDYDRHNGSRMASTQDKMDTGFPVYNETEFITNLAEKFNFSSKHLILYTPKSEVAERIIRKFVDKMELFVNPKPENRTEHLMVNITDFPDEDEMVKFNSLNMVKSHYADSPEGEEFLNVLFGLVFDGLSGNELGPKVSYKIRMNYALLGPKDSMYPDPNPGPNYDWAYKYVSSGFIGIQYLLDKILIEEYTNDTVPPNMFALQAFPYPPYDEEQENKDKTTNESKGIAIALLLVTGFVFIVPQVLQGVVSEKETGIKELLKMSGLPEWMHWFGWMLNSLAISTVSVIIIVTVLFVPFNSRAGGVVKHSDPTLCWAVLMIYTIWAITYCFAVAAFFEKPTLAITVGIIIWLVSFFGLGVTMQDSYGKDFSTGVTLLFCLFPNVAITLALNAILDFEISETGSKWGNIHQTIAETSAVPLLYVILMFLVSICLNMIICLYIEAVFPKQYGVRKPFYYLFLPSEWGFGNNRVSDGVVTNDGTSAANTKPGFEDDPRGIKAGVQIKNLRKEFGKEKVAVNDVTMNIFEGQIFCLLGHNGAGKTTMMSILTGLTPPTAGTAFIDGYDIRTNMNKIRENLGLCPQHNMLFDEMTVIEHLKFFGMLRGLSLKNAEMEGEELVRVLQMEEKKNVLSMSLSGGQKRRLSLGCAIVGGSKVIFLDEPTSGMDPEARRAIWDILLKIRGERTIVLTTHFMEEADVLGDRIAILSNGTLQCCGTPNFLKRFYGAGYTLNMSTTDGANREEILLTVCKHMKDANFKGSQSNNATELSIVLPSDSNTTAKFPDLFSELRREQKRLHIDEIGVGWTTMDEVFVRVEELSHHEEENNHNEQTIHQNGTGPSNELEPNHDKLTGLKLATSQFYGLLMKKLFSTMRQRSFFTTQMLLPALLTIAALYSGVVRNNKQDSEAEPAFKMSMSSYKRSVTLYSSENQGLGDTYAKVVGSSARLLNSSYNNNVSLGLLAAGRKDIDDYRERYIVAAELSDTNMKGMYSTLAYHSASLSLNLLTNTFLQSRGKGNDVETINHPFPNTIFSLRSVPVFDPTLATSFVVLLPLGLTLLLGSFMIGPTEERFSKGKQLQLMTGVSPFLYWSSSFLCDMLVALFSISLMTACLPIFERNQMFTNHDGAWILFLILTAYALASIPFSYIFSTLVSGVAGGFTLITIINIAAVVGLWRAAHNAETFEIGKASQGETQDTETYAGMVKASQQVALFLRIIGRLFPTFGLSKATFDYAKASSHKSVCDMTPKRTLDSACNLHLGLDVDRLRFRIGRECCANCAEFGECIETWPYLRWTKVMKKYDWHSQGVIIYHVPALAQDLFWLLFMGIVYFVILMLIEYGVFQRLWEGIFKQKQSDFRSTVDDNDVLEENERVSQLVNTGNSSEDALVVDNLCKSFGGSFSAVSKLSFGVHHGECFGLLGVNGAGKTTTFRMLTGDENRSNGNAFMNNLSLASGRKQFLSMLGYCPQFDGFVEILSGKEMLRLFARLRGIPGNKVEDEADKWLQRAGLTTSANVQCKRYSGGMKRRLSTAMALIGNPAVILLDEPTSGVDPVARRQFWKIISSVKNSGQAIILTSHSMDECEALCSRLGIMVNGEMQCLGGVQHLKNKFVQGYSLTLKLKEDAIQDNGNVVQAITDSISQNFEPSSLKDHHQTTMKFHINSRSLSWEELYGRMERIKTDFQEVIEEYAITETTLEEVFLSFARKQYVNERVTKNSGISSLLGSCVSVRNSPKTNSAVTFNPKTENPDGRS